MTPAQLSALFSATMLLVPGRFLRSQPTASCKTQNLSLNSYKATIAGGGRLAYNFTLTNEGNRVCALSGYPKAIALGKDRKPVQELHFLTSRGAIAGPPEQRISVIHLEPGDHAWFQIIGSDGMGLPDLSLCPKAAYIQITPPDNTQPFRPTSFMTCTDPLISFLLPRRPSDP